MRAEESVEAAPANPEVAEQMEGQDRKSLKPDTVRGYTVWLRFDDGVAGELDLVDQEVLWFFSVVPPELLISW